MMQIITLISVGHIYVMLLYNIGLGKYGSFYLFYIEGHIILKGAICDGRGPYVMASLPFPLDFDFIFTGPYMMIEGGHM